MSLLCVIALPALVNWWSESSGQPEMKPSATRDQRSLESLHAALPAVTLIHFSFTLPSLNPSTFCLSPVSFWGQPPPSVCSLLNLTDRSGYLWGVLGQRGFGNGTEMSMLEDYMKWCPHTQLMLSEHCIYIICHVCLVSRQEIRMHENYTSYVHMIHISVSTFGPYNLMAAMHRHRIKTQSIEKRQSVE